VGIEVYVVEKPTQLSFIEQSLENCINSDYPVVGLDAEWSSYVGSSRASVLQIAFRETIFIVDLDELFRERRLVHLLDAIFSNDKVLKIGFQFHEDLFSNARTYSQLLFALQA